MFFERGFVDRNLLGRGAAILFTKEPQDWATQICRVADRRHRAIGGQIRLCHHHTAPPTVHQRIKTWRTTGGQIGMATTRASPKDPHFAAHIGQRPQIMHRPGQIADNLIIGYTAGGSDHRRDIFWGAVTSAEVEIRGDGNIAMMCELARGLTIPLVPTGHVMDQHHCRERACAQWPRHISIN